VQIVVERLTKNVNEDHLYEIFGQYGNIDDLDLPVNRQCELYLATPPPSLLGTPC
jgi:RNA-binding protein with serine-rich domain 1